MESPQKYMKNKQKSISRRIKKLMEFKNIQLKQLAGVLKLPETETLDLIESPNRFSIEDILKLETLFNDSIILIPFFKNEASLVKNSQNVSNLKSRQQLQRLPVNKPLGDRKSTNDIDNLTPNEIAEKPQAIQDLPNQSILQLIDNKK